jgi:2-keto-4-pentenoate hydratase/2-oxohepta-3-ene-1,7-dioic acid hydratase in catechol pathway
MSKFDCLIKFTAEGSDTPFFAKSDPQAKIAAGTTVTGFRSFADFEKGQRSEQVVVKKVNTFEPILSLTIKCADSDPAQLLAPLPFENVPIYCVGLNYRSHATEAKVRRTTMKVTFLAS